MDKCCGGGGGGGGGGDLESCTLYCFTLKFDKFSSSFLV